LDSSVVIVEQEDDLLKPQKPLQLVLEGPLSALGSIWNGNHRPAVAYLKHAEAVKLALGDNNGLALTP
jgi:hypothetical protein